GLRPLSGRTPRSRCSMKSSGANRYGGCMSHRAFRKYNSCTRLLFETASNHSTTLDNRNAISLLSRKDPEDSSYDREILPQIIQPLAIRGEDSAVHCFLLQVYRQRLHPRC